jgi:2-phospho-L-lactate guanylyltransferase
MRALLLPVKRRENAKQRLAPVLSPADRRALMEAMIADGFAAARAAVRPERVYVVTADAEVAATAAGHGWRVLAETEQVSESASVDRAAAICAAEGVTSLLRLPLDLPLVTGADIDAVFDAASTADAVIVPSRDGTGTNAILRRPPTLFRSHFGPGSLALHRRAAADARARVAILKIMRIAMDVDDADDLSALLAHQPRRATRDWLAARPEIAPMLAARARAD